MNNGKVRRMAGIALLMAMIVALQFLSAAIPSVGGFSFSLVLIPIVLGAAVYGPKIGAFLGGVFGVIVFINCVNGTDVGGQMVFQAGPVLCFIVVLGKGILAGLAAGAVYKLVRKHDQKGYAAMLCAAIICPVVNTGTFIVCMLTMFRSVLSVWAGGGALAAYILSGLLLANFLPELLINVLFSPAGQRITQAVTKKG